MREIFWNSIGLRDLTKTRFYIILPGRTQLAFAGAVRGRRGQAEELVPSCGTVGVGRHGWRSREVTEGEDDEPHRRTVGEYTRKK